MSDTKTNPAHYRLGKIEVIEVTEQFDFCTGNALKYLMRAGNKEGESALDDLKKARWYVERLIANEEAKTPEKSSFWSSVKQSASQIRQESEGVTDITDPAGIRNWGKY